MTRRVRLVDVTVAFAAPPTTVFDYLTDPSNRPEWQSSLRRVDHVQVLGDVAGDVGTSWVDVTAVPGVTPHLEVVVCEPARRWVEIGRWRSVDAELALDFSSATGEYTDVRAVAHLTVGALVLPATPALRAVAPLGLRSDLRAAAKLLANNHSR